MDIEEIIQTLFIATSDGIIKWGKEQKGTKQRLKELEKEISKERNPLARMALVQEFKKLKMGKPYIAPASYTSYVKINYEKEFLFRLSDYIYLDCRLFSVRDDIILSLTKMNRTYSNLYNYGSSIYGTGTFSVFDDEQPLVATLFVLAQELAIEKRFVKSGGWDVYRTSNGGIYRSKEEYKKLIGD